MCDYFAPLLTQTGKDLPAKLLQLEYIKDILTQQLQTYEDKQTKVCKYLFNKYWANCIFKKGNCCESSEDSGETEHLVHVRGSKGQRKGGGILDASI